MYKKFGLLVAILPCLAAMPVLCPASAYPDTREYAVKAVFLERFARFVEWPGESDDTAGPFVVAVIGENPFGPFLNRLYSKQKIKNRKVVIRYLSESTEHIPDCHILFISASMEEDIQSIVSATKDRPILTIGDTKGFAEKKVHINLYSEDEKYPFEINPGAVRDSGLEMDHLLMNLAKIIE